MILYYDLPLHVKEQLPILRIYAEVLEKTFNVPIYLVGSALRYGNIFPRDWDIRARLTNIAFTERYGDYKLWYKETKLGLEYTEPIIKWSDECVKLTKQGWEITQLNIDFQIVPHIYWKEFSKAQRYRLCTQ